MAIINLSTLPELAELVLIKNKEDLQDFLKTLRQDEYSQEKLEELKLDQQLEHWLMRSELNYSRLFASCNEKDAHGRGVGWGKHKLYRVLIATDRFGEVFVFKNVIHEFCH